MNTRSFASQNKRTSHTSQPGVASGRGSNTHTQRRWQLKSKKQTTHPAAQASSPLSQDDQDHLLRQQALAHAQQGQYAKAIALFSQIIERSPKSASDYSNRGLVYFQSGQADAALADYNRAIDLNPRLDSAYNNRANYYAAQGQFLEAILDYDIALDLNPTNVRVWINQGITFRDLEMYDRAIESFELGLCLGRLEGHFYAERGRAYHLRGDWNCAMGDYQRALAKLPEASGSLHNPSVRLRNQVEIWLDELLCPLF